MAIKRSVVVTCDGPCGTVINDNRVPEGWAYVQVIQTHNTPGRRTPYKRAALCLKCTEALYNSLGRLGYSFVDINPPNPPNLSEVNVQPPLQPARPESQVEGTPSSTTEPSEE